MVGVSAPTNFPKPSILLSHPGKCFLSWLRRHMHSSAAEPSTHSSQPTGLPRSHAWLPLSRTCALHSWPEKAFLACCKVHMRWAVHVPFAACWKVSLAGCKVFCTWWHHDVIRVQHCPYAPEAAPQFISNESLFWKIIRRGLNHEYLSSK